MLLAASLGVLAAGWTAAACSSTPGGGGDDGGPEGSSPDGSTDARSDARADAGDASHDASQEATADHVDGSAGDGGRDAGDAGDASDAGHSVPVDAGMTCAVVDVPPDGGARCGNGWRDPSEKCDLGDASSDGGPLSRAGCSSTCQVVDLLAEVQLVDGGLDNSPRTLGGGRHPLAASDTTFAVTTLENPASPPTVAMTTFTRKGVAKGAPITISAGSIVSDQGDPVLAALPCDQYVAAWNDKMGASNEFMAGGSNFRIISVMSSRGGGAGVQERDWAYNETNSKWADVYEGHIQSTVSDGPYGHPLDGVFRLKDQPPSPQGPK